MQEIWKALNKNPSRPCLQSNGRAVPDAAKTHEDSAGQKNFLLVKKMPYAGEDHGHPEAVGGGDHFVIAD